MEELIQIPNLYWKIFAISTCLKILLIPSYKSTDFEVHRNWLAITHSLPIKDWYQNDYSIWTLDYPPFFAWFQYLLSQLAYYTDSNMLKIENLNYESQLTLYFQRFSVIILDILYAIGVKRCIDKIQFMLSSLKESNFSENTSCIRIVLQIFLPVLLLCNFGLLIVDHIHFQYNGLLFGILFLSFSYIIEGRYYFGALLFGIVLNFKHIFLYSALGYGIYYIQWLAELYTSYKCKLKQFTLKSNANGMDESILPSSYNRKYSSISIPPNGVVHNVQKSICGCEDSNHLEQDEEESIILPYTFDAQTKQILEQSEILKKLAIKVLSLSAILFGTFLVSFGPFIYAGQFSQILKRMFPFGRGLRHDFWAPNIWALYGTLDKVIALLIGKRSPLASTVNETMEVLATNSSLTSNTTSESTLGPLVGVVASPDLHAFLPDIAPSVSLALTLVSLVPFLMRVRHSLKSLKFAEASRKSRPLLDRLSILEYVTWVSFSSFLLGWHVHEKACLLVTLPFTLYLAARIVSHSQAHAQKSQAQQAPKGSACKEKATIAYLGMAWLLWIVSSDFALMTLLHKPQEAPTKACLYLIYHAITCSFVAKFAPNNQVAPPNPELGFSQNKGRSAGEIFAWFRSPSAPGKLVKFYGLGLVALYVLAFASPLLPGLGYTAAVFNKYPFLPLMATSTYCAMGTLYSWYIFATTLLAEAGTRSYLTGLHRHDSIKTE